MYSASALKAPQWSGTDFLHHPVISDETFEIVCQFNVNAETEVLFHTAFYAWVLPTQTLYD